MPRSSTAAKKKKTAKKKVTKKPKGGTPEAVALKNRYAICLDSSGSMLSIRQGAVDLYNNTVDSLKMKDPEGELTLIFFGVGHGNGACVTKFRNQTVKDVARMTLSDYHAEGGTPLRDSVGLAVRELESTRGDFVYVVLVLTDGCENTSRNVSEADLANLMKVKQGTDRWTFAYLVPKEYRDLFMRQTGVPPGNIRAWDPNNVHDAERAIGQGLSAFFEERKAGRTSMKTFFQLDLKKVNAKDVEALEKVKGFRMWTVEKENDITSEVEAHGITYVPGIAFYCISKKEDVQDYKEILIVPKGTRTVYGAEKGSVRRLLGFPDTGDARVEPGNLMDWEVYVQSTSRNRKLVRGTRLLVMTK